MSRGKANNLVGQRFSRLVVVERAANLAGNPNSRWLCRCDCGGTCIVFAPNLRNGNTKGCGCLQHPPEERIIAGDAPTKHPLYSRWQEMIDRCTKPNRASFRHYGGRGITVCDRWLNGDGNRFGFICFVEDMGGCPDGFTLDRINNNGNYEPGNCRWATIKQQNRNQRRTLRLPVAEQTVVLRDACDAVGQNADLAYARISRGWEMRDAINVPAILPTTIAIGHETLTVKQWADRVGIPSKSISHRLRQGLRGQDAVFGRSRLGVRPHTAVARMQALQQMGISLE